MKKLILFVMVVLLVSGCEVKEVKLVKDKFIISSVDCVNSSDSINCEVVSEESNLKYKLRLNGELVSESMVNDKVIVQGLNENSLYVLEIFNDKGSKSFDVKTLESVKLMFAGDVMMALYFGNYIASNGVDYSWTDVSHLTRDADVSMINLETAISDRGSSTKPEMFGFRSLPYTTQGLTNAGIDIVSIANNHVIDFGYDAFSDTMYNLNKYGIKYVGAGNNLSEALEVKYFEVNGLKIGYMAATSILGYSSWKATESKAGVMPLMEEYYEMLFDKIKEVDELCDYLVLNVHWGSEYNNYPSEAQVELAHTLVDNGVDILVGHHPHVLQGVEYYKDAIIYYSLGNFIFLIMDDNASRTGLFEVVIDKEKIISSKMYPVEINACKANLLDKDDNEYGIIIDSMNDRCSRFNVNVDKDGNFKKN